MKNSIIPICIAAITVVSPANAGVWRSLLNPEKEKKIQIVIEQMPELVSFVVEAEKIGRMCYLYGKNIRDKMINDINEGQDSEFSIDLAQCCHTFNEAAVSHIGGFWNQFVDPYRTPRYEIGKNYENIAKRVDKVATWAVSKTPSASPEKIIEQTRYTWSRTSSICQKPVQHYMNGSLR